MSYLLNRLTLVILLLVVTGCGIQGSYTEVIPVVKEESKEISVYFCPREDCEGELAKFILSAEEYVHCAFFDLDLEKVMDALERQKVDVKLIVDSDNYELVENLSVAIRQDNRSAFMHNKFCVVDGIKISSGSMNPTFTGAGKNNNNLVFLRSEVIADNYEKEFLEMWNGEFGKGSKTGKTNVYLNGSKVESMFCPEDSCGDRIKEVLGEAEESIYFMTFSFTHDNIANVLLLKNLENVTVKGIFEKTGAGSEYSKFKVMDYQDIDVRKDNNSGVMHHKVFIIDKKIVITGSFNPSSNADTRNDENVLIIYDPEVAYEYLEEFEYVWENYSE